MSFRYKLSLIFSVITSACFAGAIDGSWLRHPSFYQQVQQIIDGGNKTYFLLHQQPYSSGYENYRENTATLFQYDKGNPSAGIKAIPSQYPNIPTEFLTATYSPSRQWLATVTNDGVIWIIPDFSDPYPIYGLDRINLPGKSKINSITENPTDNSLWIATDFGYANINPIKGEITDFIETDFPVEFVAPFGNDLIIFSDSKVFTANLSNLPSRLKQLTSLPVSSSSSHLLEGKTLAQATSLMPLTQNTFAFLGPRSDSSSGHTLAVATKNGASWQVLALGEFDTEDFSSQSSPTFLTASNCIPNKNGFFIHTKTNLHQLSRGIDPDLKNSNPADNFISKAFSTVAKPNGVSSISSSWDLNNVWYFVNKQGFYNIPVSGSSSSNSPLWPEAPTPFISTYLTYHPNYGLLVANHGHDIYFNQSSPQIPWLLNSFKDGKWKQLSPVFNLPAVISENSTYLSTLNKNIERYPVSNPDGLAIDPKDPKYAYIGSMYDGIARYNLTDPSEAILHVASSKNPFLSLPGNIEGFPVMNAWSIICDLSAPAFDNDGNLWSMSYYADDMKNAYLHVWAADKLKEIKVNGGIPSGYTDPITINAPLDDTQSRNNQLIPLNHPSNKNLLAFHTGNYSSPVYILDHNGTFANGSDDRLVKIKKTYDFSTGAPIKGGNPTKIWEDPSTGLVWVSTILGTYTIDPKLALTNPEKSTSNIRVKSSASAAPDKKILESAQSNCFAVDAFGRLWIGTNKQGIICLSADRQTLEGELTSTNSRLPSNTIYSLCYNPERNSMMISTSKGLVEFFPSEYGGNLQEGVKISPNVITPSFGGYVTFSGLPSGIEFAIVNSSGTTVASLGKAQDSIIQWNCENTDGQVPATGTYSIIDNATKSEYGSFKIMK